MFSEPTRRAAMEHARDTGEPAASGPVTLVQEIEGQPQPGLLIYMPVYRTPTTPSTVEERRRTLYAFVYSAFRGDDLLRGILGTQRDLAVRVYDGTREDRIRAAPRAGAAAFASSPSPFDPLRATATVDVAGRQWLMVFDARRHFDGPHRGSSRPCCSAGRS